ncbi:MAG TPA: hypothetical protein VI895_10105 [Bdellovibrionota bacterium]|nr:hypothetical protein [Bdellovibrionota bacterium]
MEALRHWINAASNPITIYAFTVITLLLLVWKAEWFARPKIAGALALVAAAAFGFAMTDPHFFEIVTTPDNIPITIMLTTVGFFTWYSIYRGVQNDRRLAEKKPLIEQDQNKRVMVWPNLVYIEFICLILVTVLLIFWSIFFAAPLEDPANPTLTPNPSKAPWYFLGLQEMLVYFDPWLAGVVFPGLIIVGLMAIPYFDPNPQGNGYFTFKNRRFAISVYLFGFVVQWVLLIMLGTFMRGPGWNFFGPFEPWDPHKVEPLTNVNLSELFWVQLLHMGLPKTILVREAPGMILVFGYLAALPMLLAKTVFRTFAAQLTLLRFQLMCFLFLALASLPIKMILRWTLNLKYLVAIPEYFFNI